MPVVRADSVSKWWGQVPALTDVTVAIEKGVTGLLGANGAGKTTLLGLILGLHAVDGGSLEVLGSDPAAAGPAVRRRLGYAPEHDALPPEARAQDLVSHVGELHGLPSRVALSRASENLDLVGLGEERLREIGTMSVGQRQRVKVAQAIAHDPDLVLLDEPTNGLDPLQREEMLRTIRRIGRELGISVVVSSHLVHEVERICDAVVVLDAGRVTAAGEVASMLEPDDRMVVELDADAQRLADSLAEAGVAAEVTASTRLMVELADASELDVIRDSVVELGLGLRRLAPQRAGLQERFFPVGDGQQPPPAPGPDGTPPAEALHGR